MTRRDYASKRKRSGSSSRPAASRPAATRRASAPAPRRRPFGLLLAALIATAVLAGLIYFLTTEMKLSSDTVGEPDQSTVPAKENPAVTPQEQAKPRAPGESLPLDNVELDQSERFDFYNILKKSEVETPEESAYTSTPKTAALETPYLLQAGSFRSNSDAEAMRARLTLAGLPNVRTSKSEGSNGIWYRVTTGPFNTYIDLKSATTKLEKLNIHPVKRKAN